MIFSSYTFIAFLMVVFSVYFTLNHYKKKQLAKIWLILSSFYFYAQGSPDFLPFFLGTVFFNYIIGTAIIRTLNPTYKKALFVLGLIENLILLGYFKYVDFFLENINFIMRTDYPLQGIILPIGISFFTFQLVAYLVDCYRGHTKAYSLINYLLFITFFPQLIVGPIVHHAEVVPQFEDDTTSVLTLENVALGLFIFSIGCAKKVMLADPLTSFAAAYFSDITMGGPIHAQLGALAYTFSYYFDLSGYADMAIGLGLLFNIHLPQNFLSPYKSRNFKEYWRRWHISLSKFLSDYVFRTVYRKDATRSNFYLAIMITFLVSGFWHGAGWAFVAWGAFNGLFVCMAHFMTRKKWALPFPIAWTLTFIGVVGTRVLFVSPTLSEALYVLTKAINFTYYAGWAKSAILMDVIDYLILNAYSVLILIIGAFIAFAFKNTTELRKQFQYNMGYALATGSLIALSIFQMSLVADFLYFQF